MSSEGDERSDGGVTGTPPEPAGDVCAEPPSAPARTSPAASAGTFWACGEGVDALDDPTPFGQENALQRLGKPPFEKSARGRFRLLGYLATVYEHVAQDVGSGLRGVEGNHEDAEARS